MQLAFALSPFLVLGLGTLLLMLSEAFAKNRGGLALGATMIFVATGACAGGLWLYGVENLKGLEALSPWLNVDRFSLFFDVLLCIGGALAALLAGGYLPEHNIERGEFYALLLFSTFGAMMLAGAGDLLVLVLGLETMSIGAYSLTAFRRASPRSAEGGMKYFLLGSFAAALLLFGFALLYGATGHTDLVGLGAGLKSLAAGETPVDAPVMAKAAVGPMVVFALILVIAGLAFKVSAVPFHMWTPDAYEGAPTPATTYMAVVVKAGAFAMLMRVLLTVMGDEHLVSWTSGWPPAIAVLAVLTMTVANLIAGRQESVKRMLAYSSIAHAGYLLVGVVALARTQPAASAAVMFYLLTYTVSTAGAFGALILCGSRGKEAVSYEDLAGIGRRHPAAALPFALFLLSLAGIPPTAGFFGKWFIFRAAIDGGYYWLTIIGLLNSALGAYYYLRVLVYMYMREPAAGAPIAKPMRSGYVTAALIFSALLVIALGLIPGRSLDVVVDAATGLGAS
ncbi:NADH-quinone oxidoreductase subunit N [soil metagenome]